MQYRKRVELILMVFIGLAWGILLSELMRRTRWHGTSRSDQMPSTAPDPGSSPTPTPIIATEDSEALASRLFNETRVLCMVLTSPKTHHSRAVHIQRTWGTRCHKLIFMSTKADQELGAVALPVREGNSNLWGKTRASLQYVYKHHFRDYDWFLKADDDTYVVMENLRAFLHAHNPKSPVYFGSKFRPHVKQGYMSGGAGYVLSKAALHKFMKSAFGNSSICSNLNIGYEDVELGRCLQAVGVVTGDSRDEHGLSRFIPFSPLHFYPEGYRDYNSTNVTGDCCSNSAITFHNSNAKEFYVLDYIIYKLKAFGINKGQEHWPRKRTYVDVMGTRHSSQPQEIVLAMMAHRTTPGKSLTYAKYKPKAKVEMQTEK